MKNRMKQTRAFPLMDVRAVSDDNGKAIEGYAAVFNSATDIAGQFTESIKRGAFKKSLEENDAVALWQHNSEMPLGRVSAGNLEIEEDKKGLKFRLKMPDTTWAKDAYESIRSGIVRGMSFGFSVIKETWDEPARVRELLEVKLYEISPVTFPAYEATEVEARAIIDASGVNLDATTEEPVPAGHSSAGAKNAIRLRRIRNRRHRSVTT